MSSSRDYDKEYADYYGPKGTKGLTAKQKLHRKQKSSRTILRKKLMKKGRVRKGDHKEVNID
jgi:hypothetical protein